MTVSVERYPERLPVPYWIANGAPFAKYVDDFFALYLLWSSVWLEKEDILSGDAVSHTALDIRNSLSSLTTCDIWEMAILRWHPQVRWSGVENHLERLRWGSDRYFAIVLSLVQRKRNKSKTEIDIVDFIGHSTVNAIHFLCRHFRNLRPYSSTVVPECLRWHLDCISCEVDPLRCRHHGKSSVLSRICGLLCWNVWIKKKRKKSFSTHSRGESFCLLKMVLTWICAIV